MTVVNLFEQSGTFKRILRARGHKSVDVDIENRFNETDIQMNLFDCILNEKPPAMLYSLLCYADLVFIFFPCTWFSMNNDMILNGTAKQLQTFDEKRKAEYINQRLLDRQTATTVLCALLKLCDRLEKPVVLENPAAPYIKSILGQPDIAHRRNRYGDNFRKPTYWYTYRCKINTDKLQVIQPETEQRIQYLKHDANRKINRSLMTAAYAKNIIQAVEIITESEVKTL